MFVASNSNLLSLPDYDGEPEMSDGISVISEGDGHNTPPESDTTAATPEATDNVDPGSAGKARFSFDSVRVTTRGGGYRPLTPPKTPPTEHEEEEEAEAGDNKKRGLITVRSEQLLQKRTSRKEKLDVESFGGQSRRFIGIYPRHVVFLMVICGIIGGMIGHLWNVTYGFSCDHEIAVAREQWTLQQTIEKFAGEGQQQHQQAHQHQHQPNKPGTPKWSGHEENDDFVTVEDEPVVTTSTSPTQRPRPFISTEEFESMIWQHLKETDSTKGGNKDPNSETDEFADPQYKDLWNRRYKRSKEAEVEVEDSDKDYGSQEKKKVVKDAWKKQPTKQDNKEYKRHENNSGEKYQKKPKSAAASKEATTTTTKYQNHQQTKQAKYEKKQSGFRVSSGENSDEDDSREDGRKGWRNYEKKDKYPNKQQYHNQNKKNSKEGRSSGEWTDKRNRGRDELRQQKQAEEKNWYLERGNEREINRVETVAASSAGATASE